MKEGLALGLMIAATIAAVMGVPAASWSASIADPCHVATLSAIAVVAILVATWFEDDRAVRYEPALLALFLAAMPLVYVASWAWSGAHDRGWLLVELAAVPAYGAVAIAGLRRWPWLLAAGIAAHGLGWDVWHLGRTGVVPDWYASGCLIVDLAIAMYVATRLPRWAMSHRGRLPRLPGQRSPQC